MNGVLMIADLPDPADPQGRTYRQVNAARTHTIPVGALVEATGGIRLYVVYHARDCDQTPLYCLAVDPNDTVKREAGFYNRGWHNGFTEESLTVILGPEEARARYERDTEN